MLLPVRSQLAQFQLVLLVLMARLRSACLFLSVLPMVHLAKMVIQVHLQLAQTP
jgi:hypothetical protein